MRQKNIFSIVVMIIAMIMSSLSVKAIGINGDNYLFFALSGSYYSDKQHRTGETLSKFGATLSAGWQYKGLASSVDVTCIDKELEIMAGVAYHFKKNGNFRPIVGIKAGVTQVYHRSAYAVSTNDPAYDITLRHGIYNPEMSLGIKPFVGYNFRLSGSISIEIIAGVLYRPFDGKVQGNTTITDSDVSEVEMELPPMMRSKVTGFVSITLRTGLFL